MPWDWDTLGMPRLNHVLKGFPGKVPGIFDQRQLRMNLGANRLTPPSLWRVPRPLHLGSAQRRMPDNSACEDLKQKLSSCVRELISKGWQPWVFPSGKHPREAYRFFTEPTETLYTLARAYNYLDSDLQRQVKDYISRDSSAGGPLAGPIGRRSYDPGEGPSAHCMMSPSRNCSE